MQKHAAFRLFLLNFKSWKQITAKTNHDLTAQTDLHIWRHVTAERRCHLSICNYQFFTKDLADFLNRKTNENKNKL